MSASSEGMKKISRTLFFFFVFAVVFIFFRYIHPVTIASGDDWINLSFHREAIPEWGGFNPVKVVPEILLPLIGQISAFVVMPIGYDFLTAISITTAIFVALLVCAFLYQLYLLMRDKIGSDDSVSLLVSFICLMFLFGSFKTLDDSRSPYLLWEAGLTCYYHYLTPALINGTMVLYLMRNDITTRSLSSLPPLKVGCIILAIYLCIFSNIFSSVFLAVYCGVSLLPSLLQSVKSRKAVFLQYPVQIFTVVLFVISALFEMNGGRASRIGNKHLSISDTVHMLLSLLGTLSYIFATICIVMIISGALYLMRNVKNGESAQFKSVYWMSLLSFLISLIALVLICSKAGAFYASRPVAMFGIFMFIMITCFSSVAELSKQYRLMSFVLPVSVLFMLNVVTSKETSLREPHDISMKFSEAYAISGGVIEAVIAADKKNARYVEVKVPKINETSNWPFPLNRGRAIGDTLRTNGIIKNYFEIRVITDESLNQKLNFPRK
ncbi:hypothetical protein ABR157_002299 [Enterobacter soli]